MRLNDPQIELVHDDPFMGYIETSTSVRDPEPDDTSDVDVGENSRPPGPPVRVSSVSVSNNSKAQPATDQPIVIVLLVE